MTALNIILSDLWPQIRQKHLYPELPPPSILDGSPHVGIDMQGKQIRLSRHFIKKISSKIKPAVSIEALIDHAVSHYLYCPWDFYTHLKLYATAKQVVKDKQIARRAADTFMDVVADTRCVSHTPTPLPALYRQMCGSKRINILRAIYQRLWNQNLGATDYDEIAQKLSFIPFMDRQRWEQSLKRFSILLAPYLANDTVQDNAEIDHPTGLHGFNQYSPQDIQNGLRQLALDAETPAEFAHTMKDYQTEIERVLSNAQVGLGKGAAAPIQADIWYYMKLAENYWLPVKTIPMESNGTTYPHHHTPWEVSQPFHDIDPWTSFGKIMPGITQTWQRQEGEMFGAEEETPDCLIAIDSSSSMINPRQRLSHAVLGAACACEAYIRNGAQVAIYNFSDAAAGSKLIQDYTHDRYQLYDTLCHYLGGGTRMQIEDIEVLQSHPPPDLFIITDMQIINIKDLINYLSTCQNRVTAVHIGANSYVDSFQKQLKLRPNISLFGVSNSSDIPDIVLGRVRRYLYGHAL